MGPPRGSVMTTKLGRSSVSEPRPSLSQEPSDGRPTWLWPVFIMSMEGS